MQIKACRLYRGKYYLSNMITASKQRAFIVKAVIFFTVSTLITWWFIQVCPLYNSMQQKLLSCGIAGAKWGIQILAALFLLKEKKWLFVKNIGIACLIGSVILLPYAVCAQFFTISSAGFFTGSLLLAVAAMIYVYALAVRATGAGIKWWLGWLGCLAVAILLQLTVVFNVL
jgi:hypothetical protein